MFLIMGKYFHKKMAILVIFGNITKIRHKDFFAAGKFQKKSMAAHLSFFSSFLSFFFASWLPAAACFESSSAFAFFTWFSFTSCFLLVGIQSPRYTSG
jgi:hypothetical protein